MEELYKPRTNDDIVRLGIHRRYGDRCLAIVESNIGRKRVIYRDASCQLRSQRGEVGKEGEEGRIEAIASNSEQ